MSILIYISSIIDALFKGSYEVKDGYINFYSIWKANEINYVYEVKNNELNLKYIDLFF